AGALAVAGRLDLLGRETGHEAERREHLDVLLEERRGLLDALLHAIGNVERVTDAEIAAQLGLPSGPGARLAKRANDPFAGAARRRAATDEAVDPVLGHEVEGARAGADHRLPAFHGKRLRPRHQRDVTDVVAAIGHGGRNRVVLALVRERAL